MNHISHLEIIFNKSPLPEKDAELVGYAALMARYDLCIPRPERLSVISKQHKRYETQDWRLFTPRHSPEDTLPGHLTFALKHEGVDLALLHTLFKTIMPTDLEDWITKEPTGQYSRRIWFLYEWLMDKPLNLPNVEAGDFVDALNPKQQYPGLSTPSSRHRVRNNLPGVKDFCPLIRKTEKLESYLTSGLQELAQKKTGSMHPDILARAAAFLLLKDTKASFAIEGETPGRNRAERWGQVIGQAGQHPLSLEEFYRLQSIVIEDKRFLKLGLRQEGGFIGVHDRGTGEPIPDHISAKWQDLPGLMKGLLESYERLQQGPLDPIFMATMIAFGFVFIHPLVDGNGRIHRYLIHHVLGDKGFTPKGIIFPISAVMLRRIDDYKLILESYSRPILPFIEWVANGKGNVDVLNETIDLYRFFDATKQAEFLVDCVYETITEMLPEEISYLERYDRLKAAITSLFDMPPHKVSLLIRFLEQNAGKLSKRARDKEFQELTDDESENLEQIFSEISEATEDQVV